MLKFFLLIFLLFLSKSFSQPEKTDGTIFDVISIGIVIKILNASIYLDEKYSIIKPEYYPCYSELFNFFGENTSLDYKTIYPQLFDNNGKGLDDLGKEIECLNTNLYAQYYFIHVETNETIVKTDNGITDYLNRKYVSLGFCLPKQCNNLVNNILNKMSGTKVSIFNNHTINSINFYMKKDIEINILFDCLFWFFVGLLAIKTIFGLIAKLKYRNGYEYHGITLYKEKESRSRTGSFIEEKDEDLTDPISVKNKNKGDNSNEYDLKGEYNPNYDFESYYPLYFRLVKYLDLFNNIVTFIKKRNRYYNEKDIVILCSLKTLVLGYLILSEIIRILIDLPNSSVLDQEFYKSNTMILYKRTTNALTFWTVLEAATFSFKLMKYTKKRFDKIGKNDLSKRGQTLYLIERLFIFFTFILPKLILFFFIYFLFYKLFGKYACNFQSQMTYYYISQNFIKNKTCINDAYNVFLPFMYYKYKLPTDYYRICFPFVYVYSNMFYSSLLFMIILTILFYLQYYVVDILLTLIASLNIIISYIYIFNKDNLNETNDANTYRFINFSGENYSIFYPHIFFSVYYFGCLLGFCFYYYSEHNIRLINLNKTKSNSFSLRNLSDESESTTILNNKKNSLDNKDEIKEKEKDNFYQPMKFCSSIIISLRYSSNIGKILLILLYFIISFFLSIYGVMELNKFPNYNIEIKTKFHSLYLLYFFEKIINIFLFIFFTCLTLVLSKKYLLIKAMRAPLFIPISRSGFFIACSYQSIIYFLYCLFQLKIKIGFLIIIDIFLAFYTLIIVFCILATIIVELPFRILIKNLMRDEQKDKNKEALYLMKQFQ